MVLSGLDDFSLQAVTTLPASAFTRDSFDVLDGWKTLEELDVEIISALDFQDNFVVIVEPRTLRPPWASSRFLFVIVTRFINAAHDVLESNLFAAKASVLGKLEAAKCP
jgi:hypothetical protein